MTNSKHWAVRREVEIDCVHYQSASAAFAHDAAFHLTNGNLAAAVEAQRHARTYHDAATSQLKSLGRG